MFTLKTTNEPNAFRLAVQGNSETIFLLIAKFYIVLFISALKEAEIKKCSFLMK